jgi:hypothetical protein
MPTKESDMAERTKEESKKIVEMALKGELRTQLSPLIGQPLTPDAVEDTVQKIFAVVSGVEQNLKETLDEAAEKINKVVENTGPGLVDAYLSERSKIETRSIKTWGNETKDPPGTPNVADTIRELDALRGFLRGRVRDSFEDHQAVDLYSKVLQRAVQLLRGGR